MLISDNIISETRCKRMILYHFSNKKHRRLVPELGEKRRFGKENITGKKVLFLTTNPQMFLENEDGSNFFQYRYSIELDGNNPYLHSDDKFNDMLQYHNEAFKLKHAISKWFFYDNSLDYIAISRWDNELCKFN